jgi:hypothetical protein
MTVEIIECGNCRAMFRNTPDVCEICPHCGHDNADAA